MALRLTISLVLCLGSQRGLAFPQTCSAYEECGALQGSCCPNSAGVMLDCCLLGAIRMEADAAKAQAEAAKEAAREAKANATEKIQAAEEAKDAAEQAQVAAQEAAASAKKAQAAAEAAAKEQQAKEKASETAAAEAEADSSQYDNINEKIQASKCENNPSCAAANLTGYCCPTLNGLALNGTALGCCASGSAVLLP